MLNVVTGARYRLVPDQVVAYAARHGTGPGEDDLLILKALIPESDIEAMRAAGPVARDYPLVSGEVEEIRQLIATARSPCVRVATERWALDLKR